VKFEGGNMTYNVFHRTWWKPNKKWVNGLEPSAGIKHHIGYANTVEEARSMCKVWNSNHYPGKRSDKAEFEEIYTH